MEAFLLLAFVPFDGGIGALWRLPPTMSLRHLLVEDVVGVAGGDADLNC
jgi:hypothetical protein